MIYLRRPFQGILPYIGFLAFSSSILLAQAPAILAPPLTKAAVIGQPATLTVAAAGAQPLSYQWTRNGQAILGATSATLAIPSVTRGDHGWYLVTVTNAAGTARSVCALHVAPAYGAVTLSGWGGGYYTYQGVPAGLGPVTAVAAGWASYALKADGSVVAWSAAAPTVVFSGAIATVSAYSQILGLKGDGTVVAAGDNSYGQANVPAGLVNIAAIAAGGSHSLALRSDGTVVAWGGNSLGQTTVPAGLGDVVAIAAGGGHNLALKSDGSVVGWGSNTAGQVSVPAGLTNVIAIAAGGSHSVALKADGTVVTWGASDKGQCSVPAGLTAVERIAAGEQHSVALKTDGTLMAWGDNSRGQVSAANGATGIVGIAAGSYQTLAVFPAVAPAILQDPTSMCAGPGSTVSFHVVATGTRPFDYRWKKNGTVVVMTPGGRFSAGNGRFVIENVQADDAGSYSVDVANAAGTAVSSAGVLTVAAPPSFSVRPMSQLLAAGQPLTASVGATGTGPFQYQWRRNGAAISGATGATFNVPAASVGDAGAYEVVVTDANGNAARSVFHVDVSPVAFSHAAAKAWTFWSTALLAVPEPLSDVVAISAGGRFSLALRRDGSVVEWGEDYFNQASVPAGLADAVKVAAGTEQAVVLRADGTLSYWGTNAGFLFPSGTRDIVAVAGVDYGWVALRSDGTLAAPYNIEPYIEAAALTNIVAIARGYALRRDGTVAKFLPALPDPPAGLANVTAIAGGAQHALALKNDGSVVGWGAGPASVVPAGLANVSRIAAGASHSLAVKADGTLVTWGDNSYGQCNIPTGLGTVLSVSGGEHHTVVLVPVTNPVITTQPLNQNVTAGNPFTLNVAASGSTPLFYQWRKDGTDIAGATLAQWVVPDALEGDSGVYTVRVQNSAGSIVSNGATVLVQEPNIAPVVRRPPQSVAVMGSASATFSLVAGGARPRSVQWYYGTSGDTARPIPEATGTSVTVTSATESQRVWARITNALGTSDSPAAVALRWETRDAGLGTYDLVMASFTNGRYFLGSDYYIGSSADGATWTKTQTGASADGQVAYGNSVYVKGGGYYNNNVHTSTDGVTWTARPEAGLPNARIVFNGQGFIALSSGALRSSPDGINWNQPFAPSQYLTGLAFGGGKTVAVGGGTNIYWSVDGLNWATQTVPVTFERVIHANGRFVATTGYETWSSPDALTWTKQAAIAGLPGGGGGVFLLAQYTGDLLVSTDAVSWARYAGMLPGYSGTTHITYGNSRFLVTTWDGQFLRSLPLMGAITTQNVPAVPAVVAGNSAKLTIAATGSGLQYQWYRGWTGDLSQPIAGATAASYTTPAVSQATPYWVRVFNGADSVDSATFNVVIATMPTIVTQPRRMEILGGTTATLNAVASSTPAAAYQWYAGGSGDTSQPVAGAVAADFVTPAVTAPTSYWARAATPAGSVDSDAAVVTPWVVLAGRVPATSLTYFAGRYFAVAGPVLSSTDGTSWVPSFRSPTTNTYGNFSALAQGNGRLLAVGDNSAIMTTDGVNWTEIGPGTYSAGNGALAFGNGVFVAGYNTARWSTDGVSWTQGGLVNDGSLHLNNVTFGGGKFALVGDTSGSSNAQWVIFTSADGKQWTRQAGPATGPIAFLRDVVYAGTEFLSVGSGATILASSDGVTWTRRPVSSTSSDFRSVAFGAGIRLIGTGGAEYLRSTDGVNWTSYAPPAFFSGDVIEYVNGRFVGAGATGWVYSSVDGISWVPLSGSPFPGTTNPPRGLAIGNGRILLLSGDTGTNAAAKLFLSTNGSTWTIANSPGQVSTGLLFAEGAFYCGGGNGRIYRTSDGLDWETIAAAPANATIQSVTYNGRQFIGLTSNGGYVLSSLDGTAWMAREGPLIYGGHPIASSGSVHVTASNGTIYVSSDLQNWARATMPAYSYDVQQIVYGNGTFVAFDWPNRILVSSDGATWTQATMPAQVYVNFPRIAFAAGRFWIFTSAGFAWSTDGRNWRADDFDDAELTARGLSNLLPAAVMAEGEGMLLTAGSALLMKAGTVTGAVGINRQPAGAIIHAGESATLRVEATGAGLAYQWFEGARGDSSRPIAGGTDATFITPALTQAQDYWVRVTTPWRAEQSETAHVEVLTPPAITVQPADVAAVPGGSATFAVTATGDAPLQYQWWFNGVRIAGATTTSYSIAGIQFAHVGEYRVVVFNPKGATTSRTAVLRGAEPPVIQDQPQSVTITAGQSVQLSVNATSTKTLTYQWRRNGVAITGATTSAYALNHMSGPAAGYYDVVVSDGFAFTTSQPARIDVVPTAYPQVLQPDPGFGASIEQVGGYAAGCLRLVDGRVIIFGEFSRINGVRAPNLARLTTGGAVDAAFSPKGFDGPIYAAAMQSDGRLVIGGSFRRVAGQPRAGLARLNTDGSLDAGFAPPGDYFGTYALALQTDGRIVAGGGFPRRLARLAANGSPDEAYPGQLDGAVYALAARPDGGVVVGGSFTAIAGVRRGRIASISAEGTLDATFGAAAGFDADVYVLKAAANGTVLAGGAFTRFDTAVANRIARLTSSGALDPAWSSGTGFSAPVYSLDVQPDARILAGGAFLTYGSVMRVGVARLAANGPLDTSFAVAALSDAVTAVTALPDGSVLIGGGFSSVGGATRWNLARLTANGSSVVADFTPGLFSPSPPKRVVPLTSGKLMIVGSFTHVGGNLSPGIARLNANGDLDSTFGGIGPNAPIADAIALANDQTIIAGGFTSYNGTPLNAGCLARINADGTLDPQFNSRTNWPGGSAIAWLAPTITAKFYAYSQGISGSIVRRNGDGSADLTFDPGYGSTAVNTAVEQPDGKLLVGGAFTYFNGWVNHLIRLLPGGATDFQFAANLNGTVNALAVQSDGRILVGGDFTLVNGLPRARVARLNPDGSTDSSFDAGYGPNASVNRILVQHDGRIVVLGAFTSVNDTDATRYVARLRADGGVDGGFALPGLTSEPEDLALLDDGAVLIAAAPMGWSDASATGLIRLRSTAGAVFLAHPMGAGLTAGMTYTLAAEVAGGAGVTFQWLRNGSPVTGATRSTLTLASAQAGDAAIYTLRVTHTGGSLDSAAATVTVAASAPILGTSEISGFGGAIRAGSRWPLTAPALVAGSRPVTYQWTKDGTPISGATGATFLPPTWQPADSGRYRVTVSNSLGSVSSAVFQQLVTPSLDWQWDTPLPQGNPLSEARFFSGRFLLGGERGTLLTSTDGEVWQVSRLGTSNSVFAFAHGNGTDVALSGFGGIWTSTGAEWTQRASGIGGDGRFLHAVTFGAGQFVSVGDGGLVTRSTDGIRWTETPSGIADTLTAVAYGAGQYVAISPIGRIHASPDGSTWSPAATLPVGVAYLAFGAGRFVAAGSSSLFVSADGLHWSERSVPGANPIRSLQHTEAGFLAAVGATTCRYLFSLDGELWTEKTSGFPLTAPPNTVTYGVGHYITVGGSRDTLLQSTDGGLWRRAGPGAASSYVAAAASPDVLVAVGGGGPAMVTADGAVSTQPTVFNFRANLNDLAYGGGVFVGVGPAGLISSSNDTVSWQLRTAGTTSDLLGIGYVGNQFIALGAGGTLLASVNGIDWQNRASGITAALRKVAFGGGTYVAVGAAGTLISSADAQTWTPRSANGITADINDIVFAAGKFVLVSQDGGIRTSTDGMTWAPQENPLAAGLKSVVFAGGRFYAFTTGDTNYLWSDDAVTWAVAQHGSVNATNDAVVFGERVYLIGANASIVSLPVNVAAPVVAAPPLAQTGLVGGTVTFQVAVATGGPLRYQWFRDGVSIVGATGATLTLANVSLADAGSYTVMITGPGGTTTSAGAVLTVNTGGVAPTITTQPLDQIVVAGGSATFSVSATGSGTLSYQWYFTAGGGSPTPITGATSATYTLNHVQPANAGLYNCVVSNGIEPFATSNSAQLTVVDRLIRISSQTAAPGSNITVPVELIAHGDENALSFSVNFDAAQLTFVTAAVGAQASDASLLVNGAQAAAGHVGVVLAKPAGAVFTADTQQIVKLTFALGSGATNGTACPVTFGDSPVRREVSAPDGRTVLPATYQDGTVTALSGYEADMNGNGAVTITDWVKVGRIVAGLDPIPSGVDFRKADCAPRSSLGNGTLSITDWVQAGRYAAGLDPLTPVGGPAAP